MEDHERRWPEANNTVAGRTPSSDHSERTP
jgi:hypothetical protein